MTQLDSVGTLEAWETTPGITVVSAHGPVDGRMAGELRDLLLPLAAADGGLVVDLADAHGVDETILQVLGRAAHLAARRGQPMRVITRSTIVVDMVEQSGLGEVVIMRATLEKALE